jgi:hypothetical protein
MKKKILDLLILPDSFFSEKILEPVNLKIPAIIALAGAIISAILGYQVSVLSARMFSQVDMAGMESFISIFGAVGAFLAFLIIWWLVFSGVLHLISMLFSGKGTFKRTLEFVGYGLVPMVVGSFITLTLSFYYLPMVSVPVIRSIQDPTAIQAATTQLMSDPAMKEFTQVSTLISLIFLIWTANIWIFGLKHARELKLKHAVLTVAIPVLIYIIYMIYTIFSGISVPGGV